MVYWRIDGAMLPLWVASEMGEEGVHAVSSAFAVTFHNVLSTASASSSTNTGVSDNITFATGAQARPTVGRGAGNQSEAGAAPCNFSGRGREFCICDREDARVSRLRVRRGAGEIGNPGPGVHGHGMLVEFDFPSPLGSDRFRGAPQEGLRGSEVEGRKSRPVVFSLPSAAALVTAAFRFRPCRLRLRTS